MKDRNATEDILKNLQRERLNCDLVKVARWCRKMNMHQQALIDLQVIL